MPWLNGDPPAVERGVGVLLVAGTAPCVHDDLGAAPEGEMLAVNLAGVHFENARHWATVNEHELPDLVKSRMARGYRMAGVDLHAPGHAAGAHLWHMRRPSSGLFGALVGMSLGYWPVVLCGCPQTGKNGFDGHKGNYEETFACWVEDAPHMRGRVFSMSGKTRDLLGPP
jgi:hypothetical protein